MVFDMETSYFATVGGKTLVSKKENFMSMEYDMMDADSLHYYSVQDAEMQTEPEHESSCLLPLRRFMDADSLATADECVNDSFFTPPSKSVGASRNSSKQKSRGPYRRYTAYQVEKLFYLVIEEGMTAKAATLQTGINIRTAQHYVKKYNDDEERRLPFNVKKTAGGRKPKLTEVHSQYLLVFIDEHPTAVLDILYGA